MCCIGVSQSDAALNGGSVAEQRALSPLADKEHEVSTWCPLDIVLLLSHCSVSSPFGANISEASSVKKGIKEMEKLPFLCLIPYDLTNNFAEKRHKK